MSDIKTLAIIGASGNVGEVVLPTFLQKTNLKITVISRPESKATFPSSVQVIRASIDDPSSFEKALQGQDAVLSLIASSEVSKEGMIVDAAAKAGVKYFVPSEFGHDTTDPKVLELLPVFKAKTAVTKKLESHEEKMGWTGIVTGLFLDWGFTSGFLGYDFKSRTATIWDEGTHRFPVTNVTDIAEALVTLFTDTTAREKVRNRHVRIFSVKTSQHDILAAVEKATGVKWAVKHVSGKDFVADGKEKLASGDARGAVPIILSIAFLDAGWRDWAAEAEEDKKILLPNSTETLEETALRVA